MAQVSHFIDFWLILTPIGATASHRRDQKLSPARLMHYFYCIRFRYVLHSLIKERCEFLTNLRELKASHINLGKSATLSVYDYRRSKTKVSYPCLLGKIRNGSSLGSLRSQKKNPFRLLNDKKVEEFNIEEALSHCFSLVRETSTKWLGFKYQEKVRFQKMIFEGNVVFDGEKFGTAKLSPVYRLNQEYRGKKSNLVT